MLGIKNPVRTDPYIPSNNPVTLSLLYEKRFDSIKIWHENPDKLREVWIYFAPFDAFEKYIRDGDNDEIIKDLTS